MVTPVYDTDGPSCEDYIPDSLEFDVVFSVQEKLSSLAFPAIQQASQTQEIVRRSKKENVASDNFSVELRDTPTPQKLIAPTVKDLITLFWEPKTNHVFPFLTVPPEQFKAYLDCYLKWFSETYPDIVQLNIFHKEYKDNNLFSEELPLIHTLPPNEACPVIGYAQKIDIPNNTHIFVRADLHGNLDRLIFTLLILQKSGFLDENIKCKPNFKMIFLGDYCDRNPYTLEVLELLMSLKMENPNQVFLVRGNHEDLALNLSQLHENRNRPRHPDDINFSQFFCKDNVNRLALTNFYQTLPLALFVSKRDPLNVDDNFHRKYSLFCHAMIEPSFDSETLLDAPEYMKSVPVLRDRKLSDSVTLVSERFKDLYLSEIQDYQLQHMDNPSYVNHNIWAIEKQKTLSTLQRKTFWCLFSAYQTEYLSQITENLVDYIKQHWPFFTYFTTTDIQQQTKIPISPEEIKASFKTAHDIHLSVEDTKCILDATAGFNHTIEHIFKGHQHCHQTYSIHDKDLVYALTCAPLILINQRYQLQNGDTFAILTPPSSQDLDWNVCLYKL